MCIRYLLFDLDDTLYPRQSGVMQNIGNRIRQYIVDHYGLSWEEAAALARRYHDQYGTSMRGLLLHNNLDPDDFLAYVHDFPLDDLLVPNDALNVMLADLPGEKVIFTNADRAHAERVLGKLQIRRHFSRIVDVTAVGYISKPNPEAYTNCLDLLNAQASECVFIDDAARNLDMAGRLGMTTVLVDGPAEHSADYHIPTILDLPAVIEAICRKPS
jgi:putative hydrolase of the HAD superfamily